MTWAAKSKKKKKKNRLILEIGFVDLAQAKS
jgi:hypothetical protein